MNLEMKKYTIDDLMKEYLDFCQYASLTQDVKSDKVGDFIGWLKNKELKHKKS